MMKSMEDESFLYWSGTLGELTNSKMGWWQVTWIGEEELLSKTIGNSGHLCLVGSLRSHLTYFAQHHEHMRPRINQSAEDAC